MTADRAIALSQLLLPHATPPERVVRSRAIRHELLPSPADPQELSGPPVCREELVGATGPGEGSDFQLLLAANIPASCQRDWSDAEVARFEVAFRANPKNFVAMAAEMDSRSVSELVYFYYKWKKTARAERLLLECKLARRTRTAHRLLIRELRADPPPRLQAGPGMAAVEEILGTREHDDGRIEYLVKWVGAPSTRTTWEPASHLAASAVLARFVKATGGARPKRCRHDDDSRAPVVHPDSGRHGQPRHLQRDERAYYDGQRENDGDRGEDRENDHHHHDDVNDHRDDDHHDDHDRAGSQRLAHSDGHLHFAQLPHPHHPHLLPQHAHQHPHMLTQPVDFLSHASLGAMPFGFPGLPASLLPGGVMPEHMMMGLPSLPMLFPSLTHPMSLPLSASQYMLLPGGLPPHTQG